MKQSCFHCSDEIIGKEIKFDDKVFCCNGCKSVYQLLSSNSLDSFYSIENNAGTRPVNSEDRRFAFLDVPKIRAKHIEFEDENSIRLTLFLPQIHCSSCIYLLENIHKLEPKIKSCQVNFAKREAYFILDSDFLISNLAELLSSIGYIPNFGNRSDSSKKQNYKYLYKLGVAGFAFGSIMLWSVPEHLGIENDNSGFMTLTSYLTLFISIPVLFYSANEYLISAYKAIKHKSLNLDVPISIGIIALYGQSTYSIISGNGSGYMDSFSGFIFFLLIGKWFQSKTYQSLSFDRDYTSYFPVAVAKIKDSMEEIVEIEDIAVGDTISLRNQEVIPCDSYLASDEINIDYSFVTGESNPIKKIKGEFIYAGGKVLGKKTEFIVDKKSNRSHLTQLWNDFAKKEIEIKTKSDKFSIYFLVALLIISILAGILWFFRDQNRVVEIVVSVLIVACPCALALSRPFSYGNVMRYLGRKKMFLKNTEIIQKLNETTDIIFDKTGTLTSGRGKNTTYSGLELSEIDKEAILVLANSSSHPLSKAIVDYFLNQRIHSELELTSFLEKEGEGVQGILNNQLYKIGSKKFIDGDQSQSKNATESYISIDNNPIGKFVFESEFRNGIIQTLNELSINYKIHILSGDMDRDKLFLQNNAPRIKELHFEQSPQDKLNYIQQLQRTSKKCLMIGDGLNDSGALEKANCGIAISEDAFRFTPSSDAILDASKLVDLPSLLSNSKYAITVLKTCFAFSIIYNIIGLSFAISGLLTPLIAAILMPISSISIVLISTLMVRLRD